MAECWDAKFRASGLLVAPATAFMSSVSDAAIRVCLENNPGIDTLGVLTMFKSNPTFGSTQTIFAVIQTDAYYLEQNKYKPWPRATRYDVVVRGCIQTQLALAWGGFPHPVWYKDHPQVANLRSFGGLLDRQITEGVAATEKMFEEQIRPLPAVEHAKKLGEMASAATAGTPPHENPREHRTIDLIAERGNTSAVDCVVFGTCCCWQTGLMQAFAAHNLVHGAPRKVGFASAAEAFGAREVLGVLESHGLSKMRMAA